MNAAAFVADCRQTLSSFVHLLYPTACAACETIDPQIHAGLCPSCRFVVVGSSEFRGKLCRICGETACICAASPPPFASIRATAAYAGDFQKLIVAFKFAGRRELAIPLGIRLASPPQPAFSWNTLDGIIPVPMHRRRFIERGYDQTLLLAHALARAVRRRWGVRLPVLEKVIRLEKDLTHQVGLRRDERFQNLAEAFSLYPHATERPLKRILLLDDVYTTGATLKRSAAVLRKGFHDLEIHALTVARSESLRNL